MKVKLLPDRSLNTRVTLVSLVIFALSIWSLALFTNRMLRDDLQQLLGEQQFSTASIVAEEIDQELSVRLRGLGKAAAGIAVAPSSDGAELQRQFASYPLLLDMFNGSVVALLDGGAALPQGKSAILSPTWSPDGKEPLLSMVAPIRDARQRTVGTLVGITRLGQDNFLDNIVGHRYGKTGGYLLADPTHRRFVTATDKSYVMQALPAPGASPMSDRYAQGYEGFGVATNSRGVENLSSAHRIESAGWYVVALLPTEEAFAPIRALQLRLLYAAAALTVLAGVLIWWTLRRELAPLRNAASSLAALSAANDIPHALTVTRQDEIGQLIGGFNRLLETLRQRETKWQESEKRFRTLVEWTPEAIAVHARGKILYVNPATVRLLGAASAAELVGRAIHDFIHPDFHRALGDSEFVQAAEGWIIPSTEQKFLKVDGSVIDVQVQAIRISFSGQSASQVAIYDITQHKTTERTLRQLSRITEQAPIAIVITNLYGDIEYVNPRFVEVTGFAADEVIGHNPRILQSGQTPRATYEGLWRTLQAGKVWRGEFLNCKKNGDVFVEQAVIAPVLNAQGHATHYVALKEDITLSKTSQQNQERLLQEKTALLNEVHHRVKNNLQVITSLLRLEEGRTAQGTTKAVLQDMQGRIRSMALVHETLYRSGAFSQVALHQYLNQVASTAFRAQAGSAGLVRLVLELAPLRTSLDLATPCGLLVNELISNSLKHGFADARQGEVRVTLQKVGSASSPGDEGARWCLCVRDTGVGLPPDFETRRTQSLGLQLVSDLVRQINGDLSITSDHGAAFSITFAVAPAPDL